MEGTIKASTINVDSSTTISFNLEGFPSPQLSLAHYEALPRPPHLTFYGTINKPENINSSQSLAKLNLINKFHFEEGLDGCLFTFLFLF